ncbi:MAG TPA: endonuclease/exonuclease/phosphatase family protein, partial [Pseudonocardia sp.]|nr:endonuclease/exonuclease/phosphatase family protein [Pseudonocardia sp.]
MTTAADPTAPSTRRWDGRRTLLVGLPLAGASALWLAPELVGLAATAPFTQVVAFRPVVAAGQLALAAAVGLVRRRWWPAALAVGGAAAVALGTVISRTSAGPAPPPGPELSILLFNVWHGRADVAALAAVVREQRPDLVVLPEAGQRFRERLEPELDGLGYRSWATTGPGERDAAGIVVLAAAALGELTAAPVELGTRLRWLRLS